MIVRRSEQRGHAQHGWLESRHTFSFADYHDPRHMGFRALRVINEDRVAPGMGFPTHSHRDMEIISYVLEGQLEHKDSLGTGAVVRPGELQRMSAGTGVRHSEFNPSAADPLHFLQIWIEPAARGIPPEYEQKAFPAAQRQGQLRLVASPDGADGSLTIHQDARVYAALLAAGAKTAHTLASGRHVWVQVARGALTLDGVALQAGDGAAVSKPGALALEGQEAAELLLFDLA